MHVRKHAGQRGEQIVAGGEVAVVGGVFAGVLPKPFGWIEFGRVGRELMDLQPVPVGSEPTPDLSVLVVGGVVLNENGPLAAIMRREALQKIQVGSGVEDRGLRIVEAGAPKLDGAQDLDALAFAGNRDLGWMSDSAPGGVQRGVLPEAGFVGENQCAVLAAGFFLRRG